MKKQDSFFNRLSQAIDVLTGKKKEIKESKPKWYSKDEISKLKRNFRYKHIDFIIKDINNTIKEENSGIFGMLAENENAMRLLTTELTKFKKTGQINRNLKIYNPPRIKRELYKILEYLGNRQTNLVNQSQAKNKFLRTIELQVVEDLRDKLIPLLTE